MKKIMFNEPCGLQKAVLNKRKPKTRRGIPKRLLDKAHLMQMKGLSTVEEYLKLVAPYQIGDVVAISQRYSELFTKEDLYDCEDIFKIKYEKFVKGWNNKMFVVAELMPHHIRILDVKVEHLQDISDEDCLKEGIYYRDDIITHNLEYVVAYAYERNGKEKLFLTPREAFASLIDATSGKGTWERNPLVYVYEFELVD